MLDGHIGAVLAVLAQAGNEGGAGEQAVRFQAEVGQAGPTASAFHWRAGPHRDGGVRSGGEVGKIHHQRAACRTASDRNTKRPQIGDGVGNDPLLASYQEIHSRSRPGADGSRVGMLEGRVPASPVGQRQLGSVEGPTPARRPQHDGHEQPAADRAVRHRGRGLFEHPGHAETVEDAPKPGAGPSTVGRAQVARRRRPSTAPDNTSGAIPTLPRHLGGRRALVTLVPTVLRKLPHVAVHVVQAEPVCPVRPCRSRSPYITAVIGQTFRSHVPEVVPRLGPRARRVLPLGLAQQAVTLSGFP